MPDWSDGADILRWLEAEKKKGGDYGKAESQQKAAERQRQERAAAMGPREQTPTILQPLVTGKPVLPDRYGGWGEADRGPTGRRRQEPQTRQRDRGAMPPSGAQDIAEGESAYVSPWRSANAVPPGTASSQAGSVMIPGFGMLPGNVAEAAARDYAERQDKMDKDTNIDFKTWRQVKQAGVVPGLPSFGDFMNATGLNENPAIKYGQALSYRQQTDAQPEQFPGQDAILDAFNQAEGIQKAATTTPFLPATAADKAKMGLPNAQDVRFSLADLASYAGQTFNRTFNPLNPNANLWQGAQNQAEAERQVGENVRFRTSIDNLPPAQRDVAWLIYAGTNQSNTGAAAWKDWTTLPDRQAQAQRNMEDAQARGDAPAAARYGQELNELKNRDMWDVVEDYQNPWAEIVYGVAVDPIDWVTGGAMSLLGATPLLRRTAQAAQKFNIAPAEAAVNIEKALQAAEPIVKKITAGGTLDGEWFRKLNIFDRTPGAKAYRDARELYETAMVLTTGITNKVDARNVIQNWVEHGGVDLINGLGLQKPIQGMVGGADNLYRVGAGVLGNKDIARTLPILQAAKDDLLKMKALEGMGDYKPTEFLAEFGKIIGGVAQKAYGADKKENALYSAAAFAPRLVRGVLSTMYLNLRPANWVRQATSQAANLMADETFSLRPLKNIIADVVKKNGGLPVDMRLNEPEKMFGEITSQRTLAELFGFKADNWLSRLERAGANVWGGGTTIGGVLPVGENAFYANAYGTTFQRTFNEFWKDVTSRQFVPALVNAGFDPQLAGEIARHAVDAGITGGKVDVMDAIRKVATAQTIKPKVDVPQEVMLLEHQKELQDILSSFGPEQVQEATQALNGFWRRAQERAASVLAGNTPTMTPSFTGQGSVDDAKAIVADLVDKLQRAGANPDAAAQVKDIVTGVLKTEAENYGAFLKELAQAQNPQALDFAFDVWGRAYDLKTQFRQASDELSKAAMKAIDAGADHARTWGETYQKKAQLWQDFGQKFGDMMGQARADLLNGNIQSSFKWDDVIKRYMDYDTEAVEAARLLEPMGTRENASIYEQVIEANRQFIDHAYAELFSVFKAMPTVDSFDIIGATFRHADAIGAQAGMDVRKAAVEASGSKDWNKFYAFANDTWRQASEKSVEAIQAAKRTIVWNYIVNEAPSKLRWADDFAGDFQLLGPGERAGVWLVRDDKGRTVEMLEEGYKAAKVAPQTVADVDATVTVQGRTARQAQKAAQQYESAGSGLYVPKNIVDDYRRIVAGDPENAVDDILEAIPNAVTEAPEVLTQKVNGIAPVVAEAAPTAAQDIRRAAGMAGVATDKGDRRLLNSINAHAEEIGLAGKVKKLDDLPPEDMAKVVAYYEGRAAKIGPPTAAQAQTLAGGLGAVPGGMPSWMIPRWRRGELWRTPGEAGRWFADDDAYETLKQGVKIARSGSGTPELGDMAMSQLKAIDDVRKHVMSNLPQILAGTPNTLTPVQQVQAVDIAARVLMPAWDNVLRAAAQSGKAMGNFAMMDFNDRRNVDTLLALVMPFHYYWSRSAGNWAERVIAKPQWLDFWYETQRGVGIENRQTEVVDGQRIEKPERLQGTIPNPLAGMGDWMPQRIQNPTTWGLPFEMYLGYSRADEPDTESQTIKMQNAVVNYFTEKTFPWYQAAAAKALDELWPLPEGEKRFDAFNLLGPKNQTQLGDYIPAQRLIGYGAQALGIAGQPTGKPWSFGDEWDAYLVGRQARNMVQTGEIAETNGIPPDELGNYIQQMAQNVQLGQPIETGIPPEYVATVRPLYDQAVRGEGGEKFGRNAISWLTGFTNQYYPQAEKEYQAGANAYFGAGYGPENVGGSKEAKDAIMGENPALGVQFNQKTLVPGATGLMPPGEDAQVSELHRKAQELTAQRDAEATAAGEAAARAGGNVYDARTPVYDKYKPEIDAVYAQINALESKYAGTGVAAVSGTPAAAGAETTFTPKAVRSAEDVAAGTYPGGRNPEEFKQLQVQDIFKESSAKFPYDEKASGAQAHNTAVAKEDWAVQQLVSLGYTEDEARKMYADNKVRNLSDVEKAAVERARQAAEDRDAMWAQRGQWVTDAFGKDAYAVWDAYFDLPKDSAARLAYKEQHPELKAYNLAAYQPDGYAMLTTKYGPEAILDWAMTPKWTENKADQAIRTAYLDEHPGAWMVGAWVNGRPEPFDPDAKPELNYGKDYEEAIKLFGIDIWDKVAQYKGTPKDERQGLFKALGLQDWSDWWYKLLPDDEKKYTLPSYAYRSTGYRSGGGGGGGGGGRSYGGYGSGGGYGGYVPRVDPRYMDRNLEVLPQYIRAWRRPEFTGDDALYAGRQLSPDRNTNWRRWRG